VADEKTRILTAAEAARLFSRKAKIVGERVVFYCDNGHRVIAPITDGGKRGTCSKCGVPVEVPTAVGEPEDVGEATMILAGPKPAIDAATDDRDQFLPPVVETAEPSPGVGGDTLAERSSALAGVADDGAEPTDDTTEADSTTDGAGAAAGADPTQAPAESGEGWPFMAGEGTTAEVEPTGEADAGGEWPGFEGDEGEGDGFDNPTARLMARLWVEHKLGGTLELHLQDGTVVFPQSYEPRWSRGTHGLFASAAADGSITLTAVAWDSVQKIIVRNVPGLPDGMFE
jgi:hypothetical protein